MTKLLVYLAFIIYCGGQANRGGAAPNNAAGGEIITDYKVDKLWDDGSLIQNNASGRINAIEL